MNREEVGKVCLGYAMLGCIPVLLVDHTPTELILLGVQVVALIAGVTILISTQK